MRTIIEQGIGDEHEQRIYIYEGARFLSIHADARGTTFLIMLVDTDAPSVEHTIKIFDSGDSLDDEHENLRYLGSLLPDSGVVARHVFMVEEQGYESKKRSRPYSSSPYS